MSPSEPRYTRTAIALHWIVAALVLAQVAWGWLMQEIPKQPPGLRADAFNVHKSIGATIFALMLVRLAWRLGHRPPPLPDTLPRWQHRAARVNHLLLYAALFTMPLAGYLGSVFSGYPVKLYGFVMPAWGWRDETIKNAMSLVHLVTSFVLVTAIGVHVAAVVRHTLDDGGALLARMLARRGERAAHDRLSRRPTRAA
jgi:cytochrome b561